MTPSPTFSLPLLLTITLALSLLAPGAARGADAAAPPHGEWNFRALLDGKPIGRHRFVVSGTTTDRRVSSEADFAVKVMGFTAYRYRHHASEQWHGDCLASIDSSTNDDGKNERVRAEPGDDRLQACVMTFAYWNPAIQNQSHLLNAQTGKLEAVQVQRIGGGSVEVRGKPVAATEFRITGAAQPIAVWYSAQGEWIGLDATVAGGRKLSYRLE